MSQKCVTHKANAWTQTRVTLYHHTNRVHLAKPAGVASGTLVVRIQDSSQCLYRAESVCVLKDY
jgi:hypothetical protein